MFTYLYDPILSILAGVAMRGFSVRVVDPRPGRQAALRVAAARPGSGGGQYTQWGESTCVSIFSARETCY